MKQPCRNFVPIAQLKLLVNPKASVVRARAMLDVIAVYFRSFVSAI